MIRRPPRSTLFPLHDALPIWIIAVAVIIMIFSQESDFKISPLKFNQGAVTEAKALEIDRKSTRLNSSHSQISYAVFCLKKKKTTDGKKDMLNSTVRRNRTAHH